MSHDLVFERHASTLFFSWDVELCGLYNTLQRQLVVYSNLRFFHRAASARTQSKPRSYCFSEHVLGYWTWAGRERGEESVWCRTAAVLTSAIAFQRGSFENVFGVQSREMLTMFSTGTFLLRRCIICGDNAARLTQMTTDCRAGAFPEQNTRTKKKHTQKKRGGFSFHSHVY